MKTARQVEVRMTELAAEMKTTTDFQKKVRIGTKIEHLKQIRLYLQTEPTKDAIQNQLNLLNKKLETIEERFSLWKVQRVGSDDDLRAQYRRECGVAQLRSQRKTLEFILSEEW